MKIGRIANSVEYLMDEQFLVFQIVKILEIC